MEKGPAVLTKNRLNDTLATLSELERATHLHIEWVKNFHKALVGAEQSPIPTSVLDDDPFERWHKQQSTGPLAQTRPFHDIGEDHGRMRELARHLLAKQQEGHPVEDEAYDNFMLHVVRLSDHLRQMESHIWGEMSSRDALTGMYNRTALERFLEPHPRRAGRRTKGAIVLCDIDHFKNVNDTWGHQVGDDVIRSVSQVILLTLRNYDTAYRYGGEEFLVFLDNIEDLSDAQNVCERMREAIAALLIPIESGAPISITTSFGIAPLGAGDDITKAVHQADMALYASKKAGRNRVTLSTQAGLPAT